MKKRLIALLFVWPLFFSTALLAQTAADYDKSGQKKSQAGDFDGAMADFNRALELEPKNVAAYNHRALAKKRQGDLEGAIADYTRALEIDPKSLLAWSDRGFTRMNHGDLDGALADLTRAFEIAPKSADRYNGLGIVKQARGDFSGAVMDYGKAIELNPTLADYPRIYRELLLRRTGAPSADFGQTVASWKDGWLKTTGEYVAGSLNETAFLAAAAKGDTAPVRAQQCRAGYFVGMTRLLAGDRAGAREYFQKCLATGLTTLNEHNLARAELAGLDK